MASLKQRGKVYYAQYYIGGRQKRVNLGTESLQVAKEKIRQPESSLYRGDAVPLPTKTPIEATALNRSPPPTFHPHSLKGSQAGTGPQNCQPVPENPDPLAQLVYDGQDQSYAAGDM